jgi:hypothetical protein
MTSCINAKQVIGFWFQTMLESHIKKTPYNSEAQKNRKQITTVLRGFY